MSTNYIHIQHYESLLGEMILGSFDGKICLCDWTHSKHRNHNDARICKALNAVYQEDSSPILEKAKAELDEYFHHKRTIFDIPLLFTGTEFQNNVWRALLKIPYGKTISYREQASRLGMPTKVRAVANANGANPISIFVPCHRVIGSNGTLSGYAGGIDAKQTLLQLEARETKIQF
jgi:methylated-DNA-[protein]-cysteine S-methyltransferase